jgi:predicted signal transduction protein with EAL and GGDEF domain
LLLFARLDRLHLKLTQLSYTDGLTGLANRRRFNEALEREWARARRLQEPLAVLMMDIDHFKKYNDLYGHQAGDLALKTAATVLRRSVRNCDVAARVGGFTGSAGPALSLSAIVDHQLAHGPLLLDPVMLPAALALVIFIPVPYYI